MKEQEITFGVGRKCSLALDSASAEPGSDPEWTVSRHAVRGIDRGELWIGVVRTPAPAVVRVEAENRDTGLSDEELEQIRRSAERLLRAQAE
jgi:hypothetical protein